jgi:prepilin peptidase CpaA
MQGGYFSYALLAVLAIALVVAAITDLRRRQIDNWLTGAIALAAPLFWFASGLTLVEAGYQLAMAFATFTVLTGLFALGAMGGGDVKLLSALALWLKPPAFLTLLVVMALAGGLVTLIFGGWHLLRRCEGKVAVPYGIAISFAGLWVLVTHYLPGLRDALG